MHFASSTLTSPVVEQQPPSRTAARTGIRHSLGARDLCAGRFRTPCGIAGTAEAASSAGRLVLRHLPRARFGHLNDRTHACSFFACRRCRPEPRAYPGRSGGGQSRGCDCPHSFRATNTGLVTQVRTVSTTASNRQRDDQAFDPVKVKPTPTSATGHERPSLPGSSASRCPSCPQQRPNNCSAVIGRDGPQGDIGAGYSITSSAVARRVGDISRRKAFAVLALITNSYLLGACTGSSPGFAPRRMRST